MTGSVRAPAESGLGAYVNNPTPAANTPWREADLCVIDLETTGLDAANDEIIAFATVPIEGGRVRLRGVTYRLVRPGRMPEAETIRIHGLRSEDLADAPPLSEVLDQLFAALTGRALVVHVAAVEESFLAPVLREAGAELHNPVIDTAELAAELYSLRRERVPERFGLTPLARASQPPGPSPARSRWRRPHDRPGVPGPGDSARCPQAADDRLARQPPTPPRGTPGTTGTRAGCPACGTSRARPSAVRRTAPSPHRGRSGTRGAGHG